MHPVVRTSLIVSIVSFVVGVMAMVSAFACAVLGFGGIANFAFELAKLLGALTILAFLVFAVLIVILPRRTASKDISA